MTLLPEIESALLDAVERDVSGRTRRPRSVRPLGAWLRARQRGVIVMSAALVSAGAATAAATLSGQPSRPLAGGFVPYGPAGVAIPSESDARYAISGIVPSLAPGHVGWCFSYSITGRARLSPHKTVPTGSGTASCSYAPAVGRPIFAGDESHGRGVHFFFTAPKVAAVRVNGRLTVLTRTDPHLPYGLRAAVFEAAFDSVTPAVVALDRAGHEIPTASSALPAVSTVSWRAPRPQPGGACSLHLRSPSQIRVFGGVAATSVTPAPGIEGRAFFPCVELDLIDGPYGLEAALLLDARHPGSSPAPIPGLRPVAGRPGAFDSPNPQAFADGGDRGLFPGFLSATAVAPQLLEDDPFRSSLIRPLDGGLSAIRAGNAWLVVQGGADTAQRLAALAALSPGHTDLRLPQPPSRPVRTRCWIKIHQLPQMTIVNESDAQPLAQPQRDGECVVAAGLYLNNWPLQAVLSSPDPLPAAWQAMLGIYRVPTLTVRRGSSWLQITGGSGAAQRHAVATATSLSVP